MRRRTLLLGLLVALAARTASGFALVVSDVPVTLRNAITATVKEYLVHLQQEQRLRLEQMARRLSAFARLDRFAVPDPPRWRTRRPDEFLYDGEYNAALTFGDPTGSAYLNLTHPVLSAEQVLNGRPAAARAALQARLATLNVSDAAASAATNDTGRLRMNGRKYELQAINALEATVIDPSDQQSATAVLDKISGAALIGAHQRQARTQLLAGVVEQLLVDSKRARDSEAAALNMQLTTLRSSRAADAAFVAGTGEALRTWRQP
jgi:hypothetical protein